MFCALQACKLYHTACCASTCKFGNCATHLSGFWFLVQITPRSGFPFLEATGSSASQAISRWLWSSNARYFRHGCTCVESQSYKRRVHFGVLPSTPRSSKWSFFFFSACIFLLSPACLVPARIIILDLITRMIFGEQCTPLRNFLHSAVPNVDMGINSSLLSCRIVEWLAASVPLKTLLFYSCRMS